MSLLKRHFKLVLFFVALLLVTSSTQSETMTSMLESADTLSAARALESKHASLHKLIQQMNVRLRQNNKDYEARLLKSVLNFQLGNTNQAVAEMTKLTKQEPTFHLAYLLLGDMLSSKVMPVTDVGSPGLFNATNHKHMLNALRAEIYSRMRANMDLRQKGLIPLQFLKLNPQIKTAFLVDKSRNRLYVFQRSGPGQPPHLLNSYYVSTGKRYGNKEFAGDMRTPEGVYYITSEIPNNKLPAEYGVGAYPTNYPNAYDRHLGKTGDGIWLHGTDKIYFSRPPMDSEGCVVLANIDLNAVRRFIVPGLTPIVITSSVQWVDRSTWESTRKQLMTAIDQWRKDWQTMDMVDYFRHYAPNFWTNKKGFTLKKWETYKRQVESNKTYQNIKIKDLSLFYYPRDASDGKKIAVARFVQDYHSNNFNGNTMKHLYFELEQGKWKIIYEGK